MDRSIVKLDSLGSWRRTHYSSDISQELDGKEVVLFGWVERTRDLGGIRFIVLRDREGKVQITASAKTAKELFEKINLLNREDVIAVKGRVKKMDKAPRGAEIIPEDIKILNKAVAPLPLEVSGKTGADLDTRLDSRILDLRRPRTFAIFKIRNKTLQIIRNFFIEKGFIEVNTPKIIASATEGGTELFPVAYFEKEAFLAQSPQLYKEALTSVFEKVFEIGPVFRAEESNTTRHLSELVMVDMEEAFVTATDIMDFLEDLLVAVFRGVSEECKAELNVLNHSIEPLKKPFSRFTYDEVLEMLANEGLEIPWGEDLSTEAIKTLGKQIKGPYFITDWPTAGKPFYISPKEDNPKICEAFDLMYGWLELSSGGTRIHQKDLLIKRLEEQGLNPASFDFHLKTFDWGMPPHAGCGIGLARLVMVLTGVDNIREAVLFPRDKNRLVP
ncbi:MAG: aspartate--tRNA(Asn) ligase [Candidatus Odinarchaeia archaeon]